MARVEDDLAEKVMKARKAMVFSQGKLALELETEMEVPMEFDRPWLCENVNSKERKEQQMYRTMGIDSQKWAAELRDVFARRRGAVC